MSAPQSSQSNKKAIHNNENNTPDQAVGCEAAVQALCQAVRHNSNKVVRAQHISSLVESLIAEKQQQVHQEKEVAQQECLKEWQALSEAEQRVASLDSISALDWYKEEIERLRADENHKRKQHSNQAAIQQAAAKRFAALQQHLERSKQEDILAAHKAVLHLRTKLKASRKACSAFQDREDDLSICNQQVNAFWDDIAHRVSGVQATLECREQTLAEATARLHETEQKLSSAQQELLWMKQEGGKGGAVPTSQHSDTCEFGGFSVSNPVVDPLLLPDVSSPASATFSKWRRVSEEESSSDSSSDSPSMRCPSPADSEISVGFFVLEDMSDEEEGDEQQQQPGTPVLSEESSLDFSSDEGSSRRSSVDSSRFEGTHSLSCCVAVPQHPVGMDRNSSSGCDSAPWGDSSSSNLAAVSWWGGSDLWCVGSVANIQAVPQAASGGGAGGVSVAAGGDSWSVVVSSVTELSSSISAWFGGWS